MDKSSKRNVFLLSSGRLISLFGTGVQGIAIPLYILDQTGKASMMGLFSMVALVPALLFAPFSGVLGDRFNRKMLMIGTDLIRFLLISFLAVLAALNVLALVVLFAVQIFVSLSDNLFNSCSDGILPDLVDKENLHKANAAKGSTDAVSMILGPVAGGIIYGIGGILPVFIINAFSFALSGTLESFIKYKKTTWDPEKLTLPSFVEKIKSTIKYICHKPAISQLFIMGTVLYFIFYPLFDVVLPFIVKKTIGFSSMQLGLLFAFLMGGVLIGNIFTAGLFNRIGTKKLMRIGLISEIVLIMAVGSSILPFVTTFLGGASIHYYAILSILLFIIGFFTTWILMPVNVNLQKMVPNEMRSRFYSLLGLFSQAAVPMGAVIYGVLLDTVDSFFIVFGVGIVFSIAALNFLYRAKEEIYSASANIKQDAQ
ncbi:MAG: MFS transporter [Christensenellales bacterium]